MGARTSEAMHGDRTCSESVKQMSQTPAPSVHGPDGSAGHCPNVLMDGAPPPPALASASTVCQLSKRCSATKHVLAYSFIRDYP